jgi:hypothetical protein
MKLHPSITVDRLVDAVATAPCARCKPVAPGTCIVLEGSSL